MKKILTYGVIILSILLLNGCSSDKKIDNNKDNSEEINKNEETIFVTLKINMPLAFEDLDEYFELSIIDELEKTGIGEVIGDGSPIDEYGPYATDIEIDVKKGKLEQLESIISRYRYPRGSYLEVNGQKGEEFGDLVGVRLTFSNLEDNDIESLYNCLKNDISGKYVYSTLFFVNQEYTAYFYGESLSTLKDELNKQLVSQNMNEKVSITDMPDFIKEK